MYNIASEESYEDGQTIFTEGSFGDWVYVVLSGKVEISKEVGGKKNVIEVLEPGAVFGELCFLGQSVLEGIKRTATARAVGQATIGVVDRAFLDNEFNKLSSDFRTIILTLVTRFIQMLDQTSEVSQHK